MPLDSLKRHKGILKNPFSILGSVSHPASWSDICVPNIMWACLLTAFVSRDEYLALFRRFIENTRSSVPMRKELFVTHNFLSVATEAEFDLMMKPVIEFDPARPFLAALLSMESLPDRAHWLRHLVPLEKHAALEYLAHAVSVAFQHQSQAATDIRWLKLLSLIVCREGAVFPEKMKDAVDEILDYPNSGDLKSVRPRIRSMELMTRSIEFQTDGMADNWPEDRPKMPQFDAEPFWTQMLKEAPCLVPDGMPHGRNASEEVIKELSQVTAEVSDYFMQTLVSTKPDPRHEGAFGLILYALHVAISSATSRSNGQVEGRIQLRTILETFILLHYLASQDNATFWEKYRKYGVGQTKLAFLKNIREENIPDFIDLEELEAIANEDRWMEFEDIELGNWAGSNLRKMAEDAGVKDVYDKFYDWSSGYVHAQWASTRSTVYINCLNPLHRFHLVPSPGTPAMPSTIPDLCKLINRMLDDLSSLYPPFKSRLTAYKRAMESREGETGKIVKTHLLQKRI